MTEIGYCGDNCSSCPRYTATLANDTEKLKEAVLMWKRVGWRDTILSNDEIKCTGCKTVTWCRYYDIRECAIDKKLNNCGECDQYSCNRIKDVFKQCFGVQVRGRFVTQKIYELKRIIKDHLYKFIEKFDIHILISENALTIPLNIPLGMALTEVISEIGIPTVAHHHDFFWERQDFLTNAVWDYLNMAFPPHLTPIQHVTINSSGDNQLSLRTGISSTIIPNVMDFENPPPPVDDYASDVRSALGIEDDELFVLQPTRVVKRKGIEHAIELVSKLGIKARLVISHASGDEGHDYEKRVIEYSKFLKVDTLFVSDIINEKRGLTKTGKKIYTLDDVYPHADLVTYPSTFEGFGNAFLEAIYFKKPIVVNNYSIYSSDIKPKGFSVIEMDGYISEEMLNQVRMILTDHSLCKKIVDHNYKIAKHYYSFSILRTKLRNLMSEYIF